MDFQDSAELARLLSLLSHELRAPLGVMRGYLKLLDQSPTPLSDLHRGAVGGALKASDRAAELLAQVSHLAEIYRGELPVDKANVAMGDVIDGAIAQVRQSQDAVIINASGKAAIDVMGSASLLSAALANLLIAVIRAQPAAPTITITGRTDTNGSEPAAVVDVLAGEAADNLSEGPLDLGRGGLGLNLPIAASLIGAQGGKVHERRSGSKLVGIVVWLPGAAAATATSTNEERRTKNEEREP
jgi:K+-sensing histidine kinase KdpD